MKINETKKVIEMSAKEYDRAMTYGTEEYKALRELRNENPGFKTVVVKAKTSKADHVDLKKAEIETYVKANGDDRQKREYLSLTNPFDENGNYCGAQPFFTVKEWFLIEFPGYKRTERTEEIRRINEAIAKKIAEKKQADAKERYNEYTDFAAKFAA